MTAGLLTVGQPAPAVALRSTSGKLVTLHSLRGKKVVLYFYPKDDTPGCTKEACDFQATRAHFAREGAIVLGVSRDDIVSHQRFSKKFHLAFPLLSDPEAAVCLAYGVYQQKSMYGRTYWGIERTTFLIDEAGRIAAIFPKVKVNGHAQAVLEAIRSSPAKSAAAGAPHASRGARQAASRQRPKAHAPTR